PGGPIDCRHGDGLPGPAHERGPGQRRSRPAHLPAPDGSPVMGAEAPPPTRDLRVVAMTNADELGYLGQQAVADAVSPDDDYRIVGGHMVRLLLKAYPTSAATPRSTLDADAAVGDVEVIGPLSVRLVAQDFVKDGRNIFRKQV